MIVKSSRHCYDMCYTDERVKSDVTPILAVIDQYKVNTELLSRRPMKVFYQ